MDAEMVPQFKQSSYGPGLIAAATKLDELARNGPTSQLPLLGAQDAAPWYSRVLEIKRLKWLLIGCGVILLVRAFFCRADRKSLLTAGSLAVGSAIGFEYSPEATAALLALWIWFKGLSVGSVSIGPVKSSRRRGDYSGDYSGDGGGATGSW